MTQSKYALHRAVRWLSSTATALAGSFFQASAHLIEQKSRPCEPIFVEVQSDPSLGR